MSGIEIAGLCFAGIAAYKCCQDLFSTWRKKRAEKKGTQKDKIMAFQADDGLQLTRSLALGEPRIREEYDRDYKVLGQVFQTGDEIGRTQLQNVLNDLQIMVGTLHALVDHGVGGIERILGLSENSRVRAVSALADQFQRLAVRAPISQGLSPSAGGSSLSTPMRANKSSLPEDHAVALTTCPASSSSSRWIESGPIHKGDIVLILDEGRGRYWGGISYDIKVVQCVLGDMSMKHPTGWVRGLFLSTTMVDPAPKGYAYGLTDIMGKKKGDLYRVIDPEESRLTWRVRHVNSGERLSALKVYLRT